MGAELSANRNYVLLMDFTNVKAWTLLGEFLNKNGYSSPKKSSCKVYTSKNANGFLVKLGSWNWYIVECKDATVDELVACLNPFNEKIHHSRIVQENGPFYANHIGIARDALLYANISGTLSDFTAF